MTIVLLGMFAAQAAAAACTGTDGRGWGSGKGNGQLERTSRDRSCQISFSGFTFSDGRPRIPATELVLTQAAKSGKITLGRDGPIYTPNAGFQGQERFCTRNTSPQVRGQTLSGCVTVTLR